MSWLARSSLPLCQNAPPQSSSADTWLVAARSPKEIGVVAHFSHSSAEFRQKNSDEKSGGVKVEIAFKTSDLMQQELPTMETSTSSINVEEGTRTVPNPNPNPNLSPNQLGAMALGSAGLAGAFANLPGQGGAAFTNAQQWKKKKGKGKMKKEKSTTLRPSSIGAAGGGDPANPAFSSALGSRAASTGGGGSGGGEGTAVLSNANEHIISDFSFPSSAFHNYAATEKDRSRVPSLGTSGYNTNAGASTSAGAAQGGFAAAAAAAINCGGGVDAWGYPIAPISAAAMARIGGLLEKKLLEQQMTHQAELSQLRLQQKEEVENLQNSLMSHGGAGAGWGAGAGGGAGAGMNLNHNPMMNPYIGGPGISTAATVAGAFHAPAVSAAIASAFSVGSSSRGLRANDFVAPAPAAPAAPLIPALSPALAQVLTAGDAVDGGGGGSGGGGVGDGGRELDGDTTRSDSSSLSLNLFGPAEWLLSSGLGMVMQLQQHYASRAVAAATTAVAAGAGGVAGAGWGAGA
eukprot:gene18032-33996_t